VADPTSDEPTRRSERRDRLEAFEQAAIEAELETGRQEPTIAAAKRSLLVRLATGSLGVLLVIAGVIMLVIPGPGLLAIVLGLGLLAPDVPFAARLMDRLKDRLPQDADGKLPPHVIALMVVSAVAFTGASLWWTFFRS
jgi:hypothetical protein